MLIPFPISYLFVCMCVHAIAVYGSHIAILGVISLFDYIDSWEKSGSSGSEQAYLPGENCLQVFGFLKMLLHFSVFV